MLYFGSQRLRCNQKPLTRAPSSASSQRAPPGSSQWAYHSATGHPPLLGNGPLAKGGPVCSKTPHFLCRLSHPVLLSRLMAAQALPPKGHVGTSEPWAAGAGNKSCLGHVTQPSDLYLGLIPALTEWLRRQQVEALVGMGKHPSQAHQGLQHWAQEGGSPLCPRPPKWPDS